MVIYSYRKKLFRPVLTDHILVQELMYLLRLMERLDLSHWLCRLRSPVKILEIVSRQLHTFRTDTCVKSLQQKRNLVLASSAEHAVSAVLV